MGKTSPLLKGRRKVACNIYGLALENGLIRLPHGQENIHLQHLESCAIFWVGKTPPFLMGRRKVVCNI